MVYISASLDIIWYIAAREAVLSNYEEIHPEHLWEGILKFAELPLAEIEKVLASTEGASELAGEVQHIRLAFEYRHINTRSVRQRIRQEFGKGHAVSYENGIHRTKDSHKIFEIATQKAIDCGKDKVTAEHLLAALVAFPTPFIRNILSYELRNWSDTSAATPMINSLGIDITKIIYQKIFDGQNSPLGTCERQSECNAILQKLGTQPHIFLVTDSDKVLHQIVMDIAYSIGIHVVQSQADTSQPMHTTYPIPPKNIDVSRIVDMSAASSIDLIKQTPVIMKEVLSVGHILLILPACEERDDRWSHFLLWGRYREFPPFLCRLSRDMYQAISENNNEYSSDMNVVLVCDERILSIPDEL